MREIPVSRVTEAVRDLCVETNTCIRDDHLRALKRAREDEESPLGREVLDRLLENAEASCSEGIAFCQDTGYAVFFVELGQDVRFTGGSVGGTARLRARGPAGPSPGRATSRRRRETRWRTGTVGTDEEPPRAAARPRRTAPPRAMPRETVPREG